MMRRMATVRTIGSVSPIEGADAIEVVSVDGWKVVTKKGEFHPGDKCLYLEVDSFLPEGNPDWQFLVDKSSKTFEGQVGHVLKTIKLKRQVSQGLVLKVPEGISDTDDIDTMLGIKKYEKPIPVSLSGLVAGDFPTFIRKTDQERCQNIVDEIMGQLDNEFEVTMKLDGSSMTIFHYEGRVGVCSRNLELKICEENAKNAFISTAIKTRVLDSIASLGNVAIQGELMGPGIQGNRERLKKPHLFIFDIFDIDKQEYMTPAMRHDAFGRLFLSGVDHVPVIHESTTLRNLGIQSIDDILKLAEGRSHVALEREGLVFKRVDGRFSFKAISNKFLLKEKD